VAACLLATVWCLLLLGAACAPAVGVLPARLGAYAACAALVIATRPRASGRASPGAALLAAAAGYLALPAWLGAIYLAGSGLALAPVRAAPAPLTTGDTLASVALAPLFEELLYRERLLPALRARLGAPLALLATSALFAAPHLEPWNVLGAFLVGLALGALFLASRRVELAIGYHAGLNAALAGAAHAPSLAPLAGALASLLLLALAGAWTRRLALGPRVHAAASTSDARAPRRARALHRAAACPRSRSGC
jgi:membrane protease YdiL (CAAX protease family)